VFIVSAMWLTGCSHHYVPTPDRPFESITEFTSTNSISLLNGQQSGQEVEVFERWPHTFYGDYKAWTDVAIVITKRELEKRGMQVVGSSPKALKLSVTYAQVTEGVWGFRTVLDLTAETSEGYRGLYKGKNSSQMWAVIGRQIDGALMRAVVEMLRDQQIVNFLKD